MIRSLWTILTTVALVNALALGGFVGWLISSHRLNTERLERVRAMLAETIEEEQARLAKEEQERQAAQLAAKQAEEQRKSPVAAVGRLQLAAEVSELVQENLERARKEQEALKRALAIERTALENERAKFLAEKNAFEAMRQQIKAAESDAQFKKTIRLYESIKPAQAKDMLLALLNQGNTTQVVAYLNAMSPRAAANILKQLKDDPALAADLLERLRSFGLDPKLADGP
ncbi:MAG: hypothetical protein D6824_00480 [Planctomycetota bacterium]|nr:MAG: hypothetical protein D6824_00480 [Planctomycetota bacterium]